MPYNTINQFDDRKHEALMGVWWSGVMLKKQARGFFRRFSISEAQFNAMLLLKYSEPPLTQQALSRRLLVDKSNMTGLLDRMEQSGLILRNPVSGDRRRYHLTLTEKGSRMLDEMETPYRAEIQRIMNVFSSDELHILIEFMTRLQKQLSFPEGQGRASK